MSDCATNCRLSVIADEREYVQLALDTVINEMSPSEHNHCIHLPLDRMWYDSSDRKLLSIRIFLVRFKNTQRLAFLSHQRPATKNYSYNCLTRPNYRAGIINWRFLRPRLNSWPDCAALPDIAGNSSDSDFGPRGGCWITYGGSSNNVLPFELYA